MANNVCAVCGRLIGGRGSAENVAVIRRVRLKPGRTGWVTLHCRCAWGLLPVSGAVAMPPGRPLRLPIVDLSELHPEGVS